MNNTTRRDIASRLRECPSLAALLACALAMSLGGCDSKSPDGTKPTAPDGAQDALPAPQGGTDSAAPESTTSSPRPGVHVDTYVVRGRIVQMPDPANPASELQVQHEAIPDFRSPDGSVGMDAMIMPFPLGKGVKAGGVEAGSIVEITFAVESVDVPDAKAGEPARRLTGYHVTQIRRLPDDTVLTFGPAKAPGESAPAKP